MGTNTVKLINSSLYDFWSNDISKNLNEEIKINGSRYLFNLSSKEYFSVLDHKMINAEVINFDFKIKLNDEYKNIGMQIKKMRGSMAKFIIDNKIDTIESLKSFEVNDFKFEKFVPKRIHYYLQHNEKNFSFNTMLNEEATLGNVIKNVENIYLNLELWFMIIILQTKHLMWQKNIE